MKSSMTKQLILIATSSGCSTALQAFASSAEDLKLGMTAYGQKK